MSAAFPQILVRRGVSRHSPAKHLTDSLVSKVRIATSAWDHWTMFYWVVKAILAPFLRLVFRPWAEGTDYVPRTGPAIIASNHQSFSDHYFAPLPLPRKVVFLAKSE
jgi:1-acyl-sn-glycerol-3-phosphate acyltransferase